VSVSLDAGADVLLDREFLAATTEHRPSLQHAYAVTGHVAQGLTTDWTLVLGTDRLFREWGYVALSRGRLGNRMYAVVGEPTERDEFAPRRPRRHPLTDLVDRLERSERQLTTIDERYAADYADMPDRRLRAELAKLRLARLRHGQEPELRARFAAAREELHRRAVLQSRAAALLAPSHLASLGDRPDALGERRSWQRAASAVEAYRLEYAIDHPIEALGERPEDPTQLVAWQRARREVGRQRDAGRDLSRA
jgi:hypothetical protein